MDVYFVRIIKERQVVGIFAAWDIDELQDIVDECCDPADCEYVAVGPGGIFQTGFTKAQFPVRFVGEVGENVHPDDISPFAEASYSDSWHDAMDGQWRKLVE